MHDNIFERRDVVILKINVNHGGCQRIGIIRSTPSQLDDEWMKTKRRNWKQNVYPKKGNWNGNAQDAKQQKILLRRSMRFVNANQMCNTVGRLAL
jgi:hypothetical protein